MSGTLARIEIEMESAGERVRGDGQRRLSRQLRERQTDSRVWTTRQTLPNTKVFHAGTARAGDQIVTNGGRVLGVTALGKDLKSAQAAAYAAVEKIHFDGAHFRRDIAAKAL